MRVTTGAQSWLAFRLLRPVSVLAVLFLFGCPFVCLAQSSRTAPPPQPPVELEGHSAYTPSGPAKCVEVGNFYLRRRDYRAAVSRFQEAIEAQSDYAPAYLGLGKTYDRMGLRQKALETYQRYLDLLPSDKDAENARNVHRAMARLRGEK